MSEWKDITSWRRSDGAEARKVPRTWEQRLLGGTRIVHLGSQLIYRLRDNPQRAVFRVVRVVGQEVPGAHGQRPVDSQQPGAWVVNMPRDGDVLDVQERSEVRDG